MRRYNWHRAATAVVVSLFLFGCTYRPAPDSTTPAPATPVPTVATPPSPQASTPLAVGCTRQFGPNVAVRGEVELPAGELPSVISGRCQLDVDTGLVRVAFLLPPNTAEETARNALHQSGAAPAEVQFHHDPYGAQLRVSFPRGSVGEALYVSLSGPLGPGGQAVDLGYELRRIDLGVTLERQQTDGTWAPVVPGATLPHAPLTLRLHRRGPLDPTKLRGYIAAAAGDHYVLEEQSAETWILRISDPPPRLWFDFSNLQTTAGLWLRRDSVVLYTGEAPSLVSLDPATGEEVRIGTVPVDITEATRSPDGRYVMLVPFTPDGYDYDVWVVDLATGHVQQTPFHRDFFLGPVGWRSDALVLPTSGSLQLWRLPQGKAETQASTATYWSAISSDGHYAVGFSLPTAGADESSVPVTIVVHDLSTGKEQVFPDIAYARRRGEGPPYLSAQFTADGRALLVEDDRKRNQETGKFAGPLLQLDLKAGTWSTKDGALDRGTWEPWLTGPGGWQVERQSWGPIRLKSPDGRDVARGEGKVVDFTLDGHLLIIRWPNYTHQRPSWGM